MNYEELSTKYEKQFKKKFNINSRTEKIYRKLQLYKEVGLCTICPYHNGCVSNERDKYNDRNWKNFRKTQYKNK